MAVPWINILAPSMGGIGPIELNDLNKLQQLDNGIPFYAGRFYPKDSQAFIEGLEFGLLAQTPPWLTWEEIEKTQIWMVPVLEDERIISTQTSIERIDLWPRDEDDEEVGIPPYEATLFDEEMQQRGWGEQAFLSGPSVDCIDPNVTITQNVVPPVLFAGYVGISEISGYFSEYAFYDQEVIFANGAEYYQPDYYGFEEGYKEFYRLRHDGAWFSNDFEYNPVGQLDFPDNGGYPAPPFRNNRDPYEDYLTMAITDRDIAGKWGNVTIDQYTEYADNGLGARWPRMGQLIALKPTRLDTVMYTIKVSCVTAIVPDTIPADTATALGDLAAGALETLGSNLTNNVWYFYLPVRYNWEKFNERSKFLLNRAGIKRRDDPEYVPVE